MTPEYIDQLAEIADPTRLWRHPVMERHTLTEAQRQQMDTGVALRRHASYQRRLLGLLEEKRSLLVTPLASNSTATKSVGTPPDHERLRPGAHMEESE